MASCTVDECAGNDRILGVVRSRTDGCQSRLWDDTEALEKANAEKMQLQNQLRATDCGSDTVALSTAYPDRNVRTGGRCKSISESNLNSEKNAEHSSISDGLDLAESAGSIEISSEVSAFAGKERSGPPIARDMDRSTAPLDIIDPPSAVRGPSYTGNMGVIAEVAPQPQCEELRTPIGICSIDDCLLDPKLNHCFDGPPVATPFLKDVERLHRLVDRHDWNKLHRLIIHQPDLARQVMSTTCQGERNQCTLLHAVLLRSSPKDQVAISIDTIDAVLTAHPSALLLPDTRGRLPLHIALLRSASPFVLRYILKARIQAIRQADEDGNLPLHYACSYGTPTVALDILREWPKACQISNHRNRLPLHGLCSVWFDKDEVHGCKDNVSPCWLQVLNTMLDMYPQAAWAKDRQGRLPIHVLCATHPHVPFNVLHVLITLHPASLLVGDVTGQVPADLVVRSGGRWSKTRDNDVVLQYLMERTQRERRPTQSPITRLLGMGAHKGKRRKKPHVLIDLRDCYG